MYRLFPFALVLTLACKKDDGGPPTHATCQALDKRNLVNRLAKILVRGVHSADASTLSK